MTLVIQVPTKLNETAKQALREFDQATGNSLNQTANAEKKGEKGKKKSFVDKLKETFED